MSKKQCPYCAAIYSEALVAFTLVDVELEGPSRPAELSIADDLRICASILQRTHDRRTGEHGRVAWRLADALLELRNLCDRLGYTDVQGIHQPTGRGAMLNDDD